MQDVALPVVMPHLELTGLRAEEWAEWRIEGVQLRIHSMSGGVSVKRVLASPRFQAMSGQSLQGVAGKNVRLPDDFAAAFPNVRHLGCHHYLPAGGLPAGLDSLVIRIGELQRLARAVWDVLTPLTHLINCMPHSGTGIFGGRTNKFCHRGRFKSKAAPSGCTGMHRCCPCVREHAA